MSNAKRFLNLLALQEAHEANRLAGIAARYLAPGSPYARRRASDAELREVQAARNAALSRSRLFARVAEARDAESAWIRRMYEPQADRAIGEAIA